MSQSSTSPKLNRRSNSGLRVLLAFALWTGIGLLFSTQVYFLTPGGSWLAAMQAAMPRWYAWGLLAPLIVAIDRRWLRKKPLAGRLLLHVPLGLLFALAVEALRYGAATILAGAPPGPVIPFFLRGTYWDVLIYGLIVGVYIAWDLSAEAQRRQLREAQLEARLADVRLRTLQAQLHPHFLFNALNTISAYTEAEPGLARRMMAELGNLLRVSLDHSGRQEVALEDELAFLDTYLAIERLRFEDRLTVDVQATADVRDALVPSFLLQPLVENAIRHGINAQMRGGHIRVDVHREARQLVLTVEDNGAGLPAAWRLEDHGGVGLLNTAQRLEELYGSTHAFEVSGALDEGVCVRIALPYRQVEKDGRPPLYAAQTASA